jgi:hypothetical protein
MLTDRIDVLAANGNHTMADRSRRNLSSINDALAALQLPAVRLAALTGNLKH